jgi:PAS domain S-box-containing protein
MDPLLHPQEVNMLDSSLINLSKEAIPAKFDLAVPNKQSEFLRSVRNPFHCHRDEGRGKRLNDRIEDESVILRARDGQALRLDEQKRIADEVERRVAERTRELSEANKELQLQSGLLQHLPVSAWTLEPDGTPDFVNQVWLEFSGQTIDFVRSHPEAWMTAVHPEDREAASRVFWDGVRSGQGFAVETRSLRAQDGTYRWHLNQAVALRDAEGKVLKFVGTTTDIDDQKRAEEALRQARGDLARINRVTTMGELAASLAHEISQPISGAITNTNVCMRKLGHDKPDLEEVRAVVTRIERDAKRAAEIIARIRLQFEKNSVSQETVDISETIRETVALLRSEAMRHSISIRTELASDLPQIVGDRVQLQQVVMNLIVNSIEAMKDVDGTRELVIKSQRAENEQVLVSMSDTGIGLPDQLVDQIFDPFFTTKPHGTGMGLRISRSIIETHGGRLWAVGSPGRGATFHLNLPAIADGNQLLSCQIALRYRSASSPRNPVPSSLPQVAV